MAENRHWHGAIRKVMMQYARTRASGVYSKAKRRAPANCQDAGTASIVS
jgi:hypothetical protein